MRNQDRTEQDNENFWNIVAESSTIQDVENETHLKSKYDRSDDWSDFYTIDGYEIRVCADCGAIVDEDATECDCCGYCASRAQGTEEQMMMMEAA